MAQRKKPRYDLLWKMRFVLFLFRWIRPPVHSLSLKRIQKMRKPFPIKFLAHWVLGKPRRIHHVEDRRIPVRDAEIPVRIYKDSERTDLPVILNFHGGGWMLGNLDQSDHYCRQLAAEVPALVISVLYRKAPENKFPTATNDAYDALLWAHANAMELGGDPSRMAVTGDSAGGNLSAAISLMARDQNGPQIAFQGLIYPACNGKLDYESLKIHAEAPIITEKDVRFYLGSYEAQPGDCLHPYFSPYLADNHDNLPPALVITAGYDPLLDDGRQYAEKLEAAGNDVEWVNFEKEFHGFMTFPNHSRRQREAAKLLVSRFQKYLLNEEV